MMIRKNIILLFAIIIGFLIGLCAVMAHELFMPKQPPTEPVNQMITHNSPLMEPLFWEKDASYRKSWSRHLFLQIENNFDVLDKAKDIDFFCPNYNNLTVHQRINVWGQLFSAIAYFESTFIPTARYQEPLSDLDPVTDLPIVSEGLLQLGYSDNLYHKCEFNWIKDSSLDPTDQAKSIFNPYLNLGCGVKIMTDQIKKHGLIRINSGAYWAVIKVGHRNQKIKEIKRIVNTYSMCKSDE